MPSKARYCQEDENKKNICAEYDVSYVAFFQILRTLDDHNGAIIAIFTIVLALFTIRLAKATDKLVTGAEDTAKRQLRAYINVETIGTKIMETEFIVIVRIKNFGVTPAYGARSIADLRIVDFPFGPESKMDLTGAGSRADLGPSAFLEVPLAIPRNVASEEAAAILFQKRAILVRGHVTYCDAFGDPHTTKYRFFSIGRPWLMGGNFATDTEGNDSD